MGFSWFECFLFFMVAGVRNKLSSTLLTFLLTSLKFNIQSVCGLHLCSKQQGEHKKISCEQGACSIETKTLDTRTSSTGKSGKEPGTQTRGAQKQIRHRSKSGAQTNLRMKNAQRTTEQTKQIGDWVSALADPRETNQHCTKDKGIDLGRSRGPRPRLKAVDSI
jgi:hypothetical protein